MEDPFLDDPKMADPDSGNSVAKYNWDEEFQRHIAALMISDKQFLLQSLDIVKPSYFTNKAHAKVVSIVCEYFKKYRSIPRKDFLIQELKSSMKENKSLPYYLGEVKVLYDYFHPGLEARDYLRDKITYFAKIQSMREAFKNSLELIDRAPESEKTWDEIYGIMRDAMTTHQNFEVGVDYFKSSKDRYENKKDEIDDKDRFILGLPGIDEQVSGGGYCRGEIISIVAGSGVGKCFKKGTKILMYDGSSKDVENIVVGDLVMGDDSTPRKVKRLVRGRDQMYDVIPKKGEKYTVNSHHILSLKASCKTIKKDCNNLKYAQNKWRNGDVFDIPVVDYMKQSNSFKNIMKGYRVGVEFDKKEVLIDPYILGIWLGDGTSRCTEVITADYEVVNAMWHYSNSINLNLVEREVKELATTYNFSGDGGKNYLLQNLRHYNLIKNKHIPDVYKINSREVRLQILAGLMDSDGSKSNNCFDFINKNKKLAEDVLFLARSLGFAAYIKPCKKSCQNNFIGNYWRVYISGNTNEIPVKIKRKKCVPRKQVKDVLRTGIKVVPVGRGNYYGFETDGNHRFLLADFTVVHNSIMLANISATNVLRGKRGVYISLELAENKIADRMDAIFTGFPVQNLTDHKDDILDKIASFKQVVYDGEIWPFVIKQFPAGTATVNTIRAYLSQLRFHGFDPDFIIVDYVGEMATHAEFKTHESRERTVRELRALATEDSVFIATAMQPNRDAKKDGKLGDRSRIDDEHLADSYGQIRPLDGCLSLNQNDNEKAIGIGRGYVIKQRDGKSRYQIYLRFDRESLKIYEIKQNEYLSLMNAHKETVSDGVSIDMIDAKIKKTVKAGWNPGNNEDLDEILAETLNSTHGEDEIDEGKTT